MNFGNIKGQGRAGGGVRDQKSYVYLCRGQAELPDVFYRIKNTDPSRIYRILKIAK